jgi:hypothetical protein
MKRFLSPLRVDGPETHATRELARRHSEDAYMCFFNERQRENSRWDRDARPSRWN